jgi:hypothetical protein
VLRQDFDVAAPGRGQRLHHKARLAEVEADTQAKQLAAHEATQQACHWRGCVNFWVKYADKETELNNETTADKSDIGNRAE